MFLVRKTFLISLAASLLVIWLALFLYLRNPVLSSGYSLGKDIRPEASRLEQHVRRLAGLNPPRVYTEPESLNAAEDYIRKELESYGYTPSLQDVYAFDKTFHNVIVRFGGDHTKRIVVGAHFDVCGDKNPGADDNASGVAGLLELARLLQLHRPELAYPAELVFYNLEEPPFFGGAEMGSAVHADSLKAQGIDVPLMISLEMIGYFSEEFGSQLLPLPILYGMYPATGNFIGVVGSPADRVVTRHVKKAMIANCEVPSLSINAPALLPGVDFSDHRNYWAHGWPAVMITDTAFLRNREYHEPGDTPDRLDYGKMAEVVRGVFGAMVQFR